MRYDVTRPSDPIPLRYMNTYDIKNLSITSGSRSERPMTATSAYSDGVGMGGAEPGVLYSLYSPASQSYPPSHHQYCAPAGFYPPHPVPLVTRSSSNGSQAGVRTIILTGFPSDVKDRELNNLLLFFPGYQVYCCN